MKEALTPQVKVSVVMCTYNGEKYLREQIESILNQTYPVYELIIQDDRSTDRTVEIVCEYQQKDFPRKAVCERTVTGLQL